MAVTRRKKGGQYKQICGLMKMSKPQRYVCSLSFYISRHILENVFVRRFQPDNVFAFHRLAHENHSGICRKKPSGESSGKIVVAYGFLVGGFHCKCISLMIMHLYAPARAKGLSQIGVDASPHLRQRG